LAFFPRFRFLLVTIFSSLIVKKKTPEAVGGCGFYIWRDAQVDASAESAARAVRAA
jgi:hypothetical protein